jgi:DIS3-like exonuclease 2
MSNDYEEYWDRAKVLAGIAAGTVVVGQVHVIKWTKSVAFVQNKAKFPPKQDVVLYGLNARNRTMSGDLVAVEITEFKDYGAETEQAPPEPLLAPVLSESRSAQSVVKLQPNVSTIGKPIDKLNNELNVQKPEWPKGKQPQGKVVYVFEQQARKLVCRSIPQTGSGQSFAQMKPYDEKYPIVMLSFRQLPDPIQQELEEFLLLVELPSMCWGRQQKFPPAKFLQSLGYGRTVDTESKAIVCQFNISDVPFSQEVEDCVVKDFVVPPIGAPLDPGRTDLRESEFVTTIDPETARDLDDAISICKLSNGNYRVGVHIADVSHFVPIGTPLDQEAQERSTSVYLVERVIPMLPRRLSEDYCSLNAGSDKYAFSVIWEINHRAEIVPGTEWFGQSIIRNRCRLTYAQAQKMIEDDPSVDETMVVEDPTHIPKVKTAVKQMWFLAKTMRARRMQDGALSLGKSKLSFKFEDPNSRLAPDGFYLYELKESNNLVEEFMLLANQRVAEKIYEFLPRTAMLRRHPKPDRKKMQKFLRSARDAGFQIDNSTPAKFSESLRKCKEENPDAGAVMVLAVRSMQLAKYCASYESEQESLAHFALKMDLYTHFTSPIRRYCDLVVHRDLLLALELESLVKKGKASSTKQIDHESLNYGRYFMEMMDVAYIADHANEKKEFARKASDSSGKLFLCLYLDSMLKRSKFDPTVQPYYRTEAVVINIDDKVMQVHLSGIATEQDIHHNNNFGRGFQRWIGENEFDEKAQTLKIKWSETNVEPCRLLTRFTATLVVLKQTPMDFVAIIHPPQFKDMDLPDIERLAATAHAAPPAEREQSSGRQSGGGRGGRDEYRRSDNDNDGGDRGRYSQNGGRSDRGGRYGGNANEDRYVDNNQYPPRGRGGNRGDGRGRGGY